MSSTSQNRPSQDGQEAASNPIQVSQHPAPVGKTNPAATPATAPTTGRYQAAPPPGQHPSADGELYSTAEALIASGAPITEAQARGTNANAAMRRKAGLDVAEWLGARGWVKAGKQWQRAR